MKKVLNTGKHVYSEKPHGGSVNELKEVLDLAKAKNLQWMVRNCEERSDELGMRQLRSQFVCASSFSPSAQAAFTAT